MQAFLSNQARGARHTGFAALMTAATLALGACASIPATESGFLTDYGQLKATDPSGDVRAWRAPDSRHFQSAYIEATVWRLPASQDQAMCEDDRRELEATLKDSLRSNLGPLKLVDHPGPDSLHIRPAFTNVIQSSPVTNTVMTALLIGPVDNGGARLEIEAIDPASGKQVAALAGSKTGGFISTGGFTRLGHARDATKTLASQFAQSLPHD